jgi:hypothetical protein
MSAPGDLPPGQSARQAPPRAPPHHGSAAAATSPRTKPHRSMSVTDLADDNPGSMLTRALQWVARILSSKPHIIWLVALGIYLIVLPLLGVAVSANRS